MSLSAFACSSTENSHPGSSAGTGGGGGAPTGGNPANVAGSSDPSGGMPAAGSMGVGGGGAGTSQGGGSTAGASGSGGSGGAPVIGDHSPEGTCTRWKADRANLDEGTWSGSVATCEAGDISADGRANALRNFNLIRWLADLPPVETEESRNQQAQACALMMTANDGKLSHEPPMTWPCYSKLGADGARTSNISSGPGVSSVLGYMVDNGNDTTHGHRRIILSNGLGPIGLGSAGEDGSSCMQNIGGEGDAGKEWMAWPPPGPFPMEAYSIGYADMDETGWSIQSEDIDLSNAEVTIAAGGEPRPVQVYQLEGNYGGARAIRIVPMGWTAEAGTTYSVSVSGTSMPIAYEVQMIECE